jgi:hypothetical protein
MHTISGVQDQPILVRTAAVRQRAVRPRLRLKGYRRIFSRFEKLDIMFTAFISFALITDGLRLC